MFILKDVFFTFVFLNVLNSSFSLGLQIYSMTLSTLSTKELACDFVGVVVSFGFNGLALYVYFKYTSVFQEELKLLKENRASTVHPFVFCIYRCCLGFFIGILSTHTFCIFVTLSVQVGYLAYICISRPYKHNYLYGRGILNESSICLHLVVLIIYDYKLTSEYTATNTAATALVWLDVIVTVGAAVTSVCCLVYDIYSEMKGLA